MILLQGYDNNIIQMQWSFQDLLVLRQKPGQDYTIDDEELIEYGEHLGIKLPRQKCLLGIAEEGYNAKLPQQWIACKAPDDNIVYYNKVTQKIIDEHPMDQIYRQKVIKARMELSYGSQESSSQNQAIDELSEIIEDEQQIANDSQIYQRKTSGYLMKDLRKPVSLEDFSYLRDARHKILPKQSEVSALQRNISMEDNESISKNGMSNKILPSSLLDNYKNSQQFSLNQYQTRFSQKIESHQQNRKSSKDFQSQQQKQETEEQAKNKEVQLLKQLKQELQQIEKQQKLKENILKNLQKDNERLLEKIRKKINRQKKQRKTKKKMS